MNGRYQSAVTVLWCFILLLAAALVAAEEPGVGRDSIRPYGEFQGGTIDAGSVAVRNRTATGTLSLETTACVGSQFEVELWMRDLSQNATGFQAFLQYDTTALAFNSGASSYTMSPFPQHIQSMALAEIAPGEINLDGAEEFLGSGTDADSLLAILIFDVVIDCEPTSVGFRSAGPFGSELSGQGDAFDTTLLPTGDITPDGTPPNITPGSIDECYPTVAAAETAALAATSATDNCPGLLTFSASTTGDCDATVTVTVTDSCGNSNDVDYPTRIDGEPPVILCSPGGGLIISEVVDATLPGGQPKFLEITNCGDTMVDFSEYRIALFSNGSTSESSVSQDYGDLSGTLAPGDSYVIANSANGPAGTFFSVYGYEADLYDPVPNSNGDDVYQLMRDDGMGGETVIDAHGQLGVDGSETEWDYIDSFAYSLPGRAPNGGVFGVSSWLHAGANVLDDATPAGIAAATSPGIHQCGGVVDTIVDVNCEAVVEFSVTVVDNCCVETDGITVGVSVSPEATQVGAPVITLTPLTGASVLVTGQVTVAEVTSFPGTVTLDVDALDCCGSASQQCSDDGQVQPGFESGDCNDNGMPDACESPAEGDFNDDGTIDLADYLGLEDCLAGPNVLPDPPDTACVDFCLEVFDFDPDDDVDLQDCASFTQLFGN